MDIVGIIGIIVGIIGIITTCVSIIKSQSYSNAKYINKMENSSSGKISNLYYFDFSGISLVAPVITTNSTATPPHSPNKPDHDRIRRALKRENSVQIFNINQNEYRFRVLAQNGEILFYSERFETIESCRKAIKAFVEQYITD